MDATIQEPQVAPSPIDVTELSNRCLGRVDLLEKLLANFDDYLNPQIDELLKASELRNHSTVRSLAHRLKGAALTISARDLSRSAERLEAAAEGGSDLERHACLEQVIYECKRLGAAVQSKLGRC